jgi:VIT1/CCC1 family predicted Fe2+/Mn2+ transporter
MIKMDSTHSKRKKFKNWRAKRPFTGGILCILSGIIILWVPAQLYEVAAAPGSMIVVGLLLGGLTLLMGVLSFIMPKLSTLLGTIAILTASLSIMGALGGFLIGTILGIIGGSFCIAWKPEYNSKRADETPDQAAEIEVASGKEILPD